jgi:calcium binding protein
MKKPRKDPMREDRIHNEAIIDAHGPEERAMGWYYYLEDQRQFPFRPDALSFTAVILTARTQQAEEARGAQRA